MSAWNGKGGTGGSPEFVHIDGLAGGSTTSGTTDKSSGTKEREQKGKNSNSNQRGRGGQPSNGSTNWQSIINRLTDQTIPEDPAALRRLGEDVRKAGANGARAAVDALRVRMLDKNATAENRTRSISVARVLAQRASSGAEAQRSIAAPPFVNALKTVASDPNVRASLRTWASQIRIGDPNDASELAPVTGLDDHLTQVGESTGPTAARRPSLANPGATSFQGRPHLATTEEEPDEDVRQGVHAHITGGRTPGELFGAPMPGGFGVDGGALDPNGSALGGALGGTREFPPSSIQSIPPHLLGARPGPMGGPRSTWGEEDEGIQSDAPSTRSKRTSKSKSKAPSVQPAFGGATPSMDGGREARDRLNERGARQERGRSTRSSSLADGTLSEPESPMMRGRPTPARGAQPMTTLDNPHMYSQRMPPPQVGRPHQAHDSFGLHAARSRSPSPSTTSRSRMPSRARAQSRRRPAAASDPAATLINLAGVQFVRAIGEYEALREDELSLREGDVLAVIRREDNGRYLLGHSQGQVGRFPAHVVEILSHQTKNQGDSAAQEEKTAELLRRAREIDSFMDSLHDFDITRYCITEDVDIQAELAALLGLRNEVVRHLDETTTGIGRLKSMLNKIREVQRVHDKMIDSRIAGYTQRTALHDATPRINYQELPANAAFQYAPFDMSQYMRRTTATAAQQIEQAPPTRPSIAQRTYIDQQRGYPEPAAPFRYRQAQDMAYPPRAGAGAVPARARTYSYTPAAPGQRSPEDMSSAYATEPSTPGETGMPVNQPGMGPTNVPSGPGLNGRFVFPTQQPYDTNQDGNGEGWGERERPGTRKNETEPGAGSSRMRGGSHIASEASGHTHNSRRF